MLQKMVSKRNALPTVFGFEFQVIAGLIITLRNLKNVKKIAIEGPLEDIELELNNGKYIYAQAKSVVEPLEEKGNSDKFKEGLVTLDEDSSQKDVEKIIYVSNTYYPFGKRESNSKAYWPLGATSSIYSYEELKDSTLIDSFVLSHAKNNPDFDLNKLEIHFHKFLNTQDEETRYSLVYNEINKFLGKINISYTPFRGDVYRIWHSRFHQTQINRQSLTKEMFLWPLIVELTEKTKDQSEFVDYFELEDELVLEVSEAYHSLIDSLANTFEISNLIINDYNKLVRRGDLSNYKANKRIFTYIDSYWEVFQPKIFIGNLEIQELVVKLVMWRILISKRLITKVKEESGL
ncbi:hypothetical protein [Carnobacterium pleistocenium]|uniref:hypothetical protein n=1 Tax=Carnobacterium pleistocenium TaxID=181073 RepID=UPI0005527454|nr:hypothetical protein [Carnobacterium pleistocenium]